jgi:hypothetical protein
MKAEVEAVELFTKAFQMTITRAKYESLEDRSQIKGYPVPLTTYRDPSHPNLVFQPITSEPNWNRYWWSAFHWIEIPSPTP